MKFNKIWIAGLSLFTAVGFSSCLDFDNPGDEFMGNQSQGDDTVYHGQPDSIDYRKAITEEGFDEALTALNDLFYAGFTGQYALRGGKEGQFPGDHSYQRQFSLGPDNYAQYAVVPHYDFMYGQLTSTYNISPDFNPGPYSCYNAFIKNSFVPIVNHPKIDSIPEMKALYLLLFNYATIEQVDLYGPLPYTDYKLNKQDSPFTYDDLQTIYFKVEENIDTIVNCFKHFETKPKWYKDKVQDLLYQNFQINNDLFTGQTGFETYIRLANSLKLRMAIHIVKVDPVTAKKWAEDAVASGVVEDTKHESALYESMGFTHPLVNIYKAWGDARLSASFESLLISLKHPYAEYMFLKNSRDIENKTDKTITPAETRIIGIREGTLVGAGQGASNPYTAYSMVNTDGRILGQAPLYIMKMSEVDFLRAEGALRGWNMGGTAQFFYERGIDNGYLEDRGSAHTEYTSAMPEYKNLEKPVDYVWKDPQGLTPDMPSVTKIGVKWNEGDSKEIKLEKIITQKYIASYPYSYEAWVDMRRTGYPKVFPVLNPDDGDGSLSYGDLIRRMPFPLNDLSSLQDIQSSGLNALGGQDLQATRLWWDLDVPNF